MLENLRSFHNGYFLDQENLWEGCKADSQLAHNTKIPKPIPQFIFFLLPYKPSIRAQNLYHPRKYTDVRFRNYIFLTLDMSLLSTSMLLSGGNTLAWLQPSHSKEVSFLVPDRSPNWRWWKEAQTSRQKNGTCVLSLPEISHMSLYDAIAAV